MQFICNKLDMYDINMLQLEVECYLINIYKRDFYVNVLI